MRTRLLTHLLVLAVMLLGFAPEALAGSTRGVHPDVMLPADAVPTGGAPLAPQMGTPTDQPADRPTTPHANTPAAPHIDTPATPGGSAVRPGAPESSATTQTIVQIQTSGCSSHCDGTTQTQAAQQQTATVQQVTGVGQRRQPTRLAQPTVAHRSSRHTTRVTRGQIGCLAHCFGGTTRGVTLGGHRRNPRQLLRALAGGPSPAPASAAGPVQSTVHQSSYQSQHGLQSLRAQRQRSSQTSIMIQGVRVSRRLIGNLESALTSSASPVAAAVNETVQSIWQLQIGCLSHCSHTRQYQQAKQTSTTIALVPPLARAGATQDTTAQSIWQLQIGCLVWCFSATEQQLATSRHFNSSTATPPRPPRPGLSSSVQLESTVASQSGGSGVTIVASSGQVIVAPAFRPYGESRRHHHVVVPPRRHGKRSRAKSPRMPVVTSSAVSAPPDNDYVVLGAFAGLIVLLATITASRLASRRGRV
ncbi:MAG: hypothetical protein ACXVFQ_20095 [Solirubrobacteraceae bacterium]